jgi:flagellar biosynthesis/type III secretory pathway M-ring protein FliF/YscJ
MDVLNILSPSSWPGKSYLWVYFVIAILTYLIYSIIIYKSRTFSKSQVSSFEQSRRDAWEKKQSQVDPNVTPLEEKKDSGGTKAQFDYKNDDKRKFKKIFGMDNMAQKPGCSSGG